MIANQTDSSNLPLTNHNKLVWGAVIAGVVISLAYEILFNFLGIGLGLTKANSDSSIVVIGAMTITWLTLSGVISMALGGWFTGRFCNVGCKFTRACHGLLTWGVATLVSVMLTVSGTGLFLGNVITETTSSSAVIAQGLGLKPQLGSNEYSESKQAASGNNQSTAPSAEAAHEANKDLAKGAFVMFIAFLLSGIASIFGAVCGGAAKHEEELEEEPE